MKMIYVSPDDLAWMRRRLLGSMHGFAALMLLASLLQGSSPAPGQTSRKPEPLRASNTALAAAAPVPSAAAPPATESAEAGKRQPNPVPPVGWRRTSNGWEHVSSWPTARPSLDELIVQQRAKEPAWAQSLFHRLRRIPPLGFALFQLTAVALIAAVCELKRPAA